MPSSVRIDRRGAVADLVIDRAQVHNAFDDALIAELAAALKQLDADTSVRAVVLTGAGNTFSAGADLNWMRRMADYDRERNLADARALARLMRAIDICRPPVIAVVQGAAYGGGVGLVACCDLVVAAPEASFCLSEVKIGIIPAVISPYVVRAIGARQARRYFLTAEVIPAATAKAIGLVHEVVPESTLATTREAWLAALKANGPNAVAAAKDLVAHVAPIEPSIIDWTAERIADLRASEEGQEGLKAFLDKRAPAWRD